MNLDIPINFPSLLKIWLATLDFYKGSVYLCQSTTPPLDEN